MKYRFYIKCESGISFETTRTLTAEETKGMTTDQLDQYVSGLWEDWRNEFCNGGYERVNDTEGGED